MHATVGAACSSRGMLLDKVKESLGQPSFLWG